MREVCGPIWHEAPFPCDECEIDTEHLVHDLLGKLVHGVAAMVLFGARHDDPRGTRRNRFRVDHFSQPLKPEVHLVVPYGSPVHSHHRYALRGRLDLLQGVTHDAGGVVEAVPLLEVMAAIELGRKDI